MELKRIQSNTIALIVAAVLILLVGTYTENGGFQLAGALVLVAGLVLAFTQASKGSNQP